MATANETAAGKAKPAAITKFAPALLQEGRLLLRMGIGKPLIAQATIRAADHGTTVEEELLACGKIDEAIYFEAVAEMLDLNFMAEIDAHRVQDMDMLDTQLVRPETLRIHHASKPPITVVVPSLSKLGHLSAILRRTPQLKGLLAISTPSAVRKAAWEAGRLRRVTATTRHLFETRPVQSARITFWGKQGFYAGIALYSMLVMGIVLPMTSLLALHVALTLLFVSNFLIRLYALNCSSIVERAAAPPKRDLTAGPLPVYSILIALYKEKAVAAQLISALDRIDWPRARLDIKLICEEDDHETIMTLQALALSSEYEIVLVPVHMPRTKPKALSYALPGVRGDFVTVYDAEDRPHPSQLREAYAAFVAASPEVICLQAPLVVTNGQQSWLIPTVSEHDSEGDSQQPTNLNL